MINYVQALTLFVKMQYVDVLQNLTALRQLGRKFILNIQDHLLIKKVYGSVKANYSFLSVL